MKHCTLELAHPACICVAPKPILISQSIQPSKRTAIRVVSQAQSGDLIRYPRSLSRIAIGTANRIEVLVGEKRSMQASEGLDSVRTALERMSVQPTEGTNVEDSIESTAATADEQQEAEPDLDSKIVRQVNFYFSDTNLPTDNFLLKEVRKTPEGWGEP